MQLMITDLEGKPFPEIMQSNVLDPIGMTGSTFENPLPENTLHLRLKEERLNVLTFRDLRLIVLNKK